MTVGTLLADRGGLLVLIDPARISVAEAQRLAAESARSGVAALLIGSSFGGEEVTTDVAQALRRGAPTLPLIQFPGTAAQLIPHVDAVLLLSLVSGRNAQYLIEEHVRAVPFFARHSHVEPISTAYILVDGGRVTSVEAVSQTRPLPADKPELVWAHARAARLIGMRAVYLDAGSGAERAVAISLVEAARSATDGLLIVGGGIATPDSVRAARRAGADYVVVGSAFEREGRPGVSAFAHAARV